MTPDSNAAVRVFSSLSLVTIHVFIPALFKVLIVFMFSSLITYSNPAIPKYIKSFSMFLYKSLFKLYFTRNNSEMFQFFARLFFGWKFKR